MGMLSLWAFVFVGALWEASASTTLSPSTSTSSANVITLPCPRDCICDVSMGVAKCRTIDPHIQHFGSNIKTLVVKALNPHSKINLDENIFKRLGLRYVNTISISNITIASMHEAAFAGLPYLTTVELRSTNLNSIHPNIFVTNPRLKKLNLNNNPLQQKYEYLLNSTSLEEILVENANLEFINDTTFAKLPNLVYINMSQNKITLIGANAFSTLTNLEELDLSHNLISSLHEQLFLQNEELSILSLKSNPLSSIENLKSETLETLDLSNCYIREVNELTFNGVPNLIDLLMPSNGLEKINANSLRYLTELFQIDLSRNNLSEIPADLFYNNGELASINIGKNPLLRKLPTNGFTTKFLFRVSTFSASNCAIEHLEEKTFSTMPSIQELHLHGNQISSIHEHAFSALVGLEELDLSKNLLTTPSTLIFQNNAKLRHLNLSKNPWKNLPGFTFKNNQNLVWLDISECQLTSLWWGIPTNPAETLVNLHFLNVSGNSLTTITPQQLQMVQFVRKLDITNNPLNCSEDLAVLIQWLIKHDVQIPDITSTHLPTSEAQLGQMAVPLNNEEQWRKLAHKFCVNNMFSTGVPEPKTTVVPAPSVPKHLEEKDIIKMQTNTELSYGDDEYLENSDEQSTMLSDVEIEIDDSEEVKAMLLKYANYTYVVMFVVGALSSATIVAIMFCVAKSCLVKKRPRNVLVSTLSQTRTKKDCGLVYKQLSEELPNPKAQVIGSVYSSYYDAALNSLRNKNETA